jgi:glycerol kinase
MIKKDSNKPGNFYDQKLYHPATGRRLCFDYSLSATGLLNIHKKNWEPDSLKYAGISADKLPELVPVFHAENNYGKNTRPLALLFIDKDHCRFQR